MVYPDQGEEQCVAATETADFLCSNDNSDHTYSAECTSKLDKRENCMDNTRDQLIVYKQHDLPESTGSSGICGTCAQHRGSHRHRFLHTACLCGTRFAMGWLNGLIGPTLPDLRMIVKQDLSAASWIFTALALGALIGSVCGAVAYDRLPRIALFVAITCGLGVVAIVTPWCSHFAAMLTTNVLHGALCGMLDTAATADIVHIWKSEALPYMQAIHGMVSLGGIAAPFTAQPFLATRIYEHGDMHPSVNIMSANASTVSFAVDNDTTGHMNEYFVNDTGDSPIVLTNASSDVYPRPSANSVVYGETNIYVAYLIVAGVCLVAASLYLIVTLVYGNVYQASAHDKHNGEKQGIKETEYHLSRTWQTLFTVLLALTVTVYGMGERGFTAFLMTFLITSEQWTKAAGSNASAVFWITFTVGRLSAIYIVRWLSMTRVMILYLSCLTAGGILFGVASITDSDLLIWLSVALVGFGMSALFATICSWVAENVRKLTGNVASVLFISNSMGAILFPICVGYLMDKVSQMWFVYTQIAMFCTLSVSFVAIVILYRIIVRGNTHTTQYSS